MGLPHFTSGGAMPGYQEWHRWDTLCTPCLCVFILVCYACVHVSLCCVCWRIFFSPGLLSAGPLGPSWAGISLLDTHRAVKGSHREWARLPGSYRPLEGAGWPLIRDQEPGLQLEAHRSPDYTRAPRSHSQLASHLRPIHWGSLRLDEALSAGMRCTFMMLSRMDWEIFIHTC